MATVLLVSETKVKSFTTLNQNLDMALLTSMIYLAQEIHLQPVIGTKGYDYYTNLVKSVQLSGGTMSQPDKIMLDEYIAPIVIWAAYYEAIPEVWARKMNKAIVVGNTEQGSAIDLKGMQYYRDNAMNKYQFYIQRLLVLLLFR
jgi:ABC-type Na+ transport system ATPase subunit NatA